MHNSHNTEHAFDSYARINYAKHDEWSIEQWLQQGGQITYLASAAYPDFAELPIQQRVRRLLKQALKSMRQQYIVQQLKVSAAVLDKMMRHDYVSLASYQKVERGLNLLLQSDDQQPTILIEQVG